jgi:hypothetical protein
MRHRVPARMERLPPTERSWKEREGAGKEWQGVKFLWEGAGRRETGARRPAS